MNRRRQYANSKAGAKFRGIGFLLTFEQWLAIWKKSKRLPKRGNRKGRFVMARFGDCGAYEVGNVKIMLFSNNIREAKVGKPRTDLAEWNRQRIGKPLSKKHKSNISKGVRGSKKWKKYWEQRREP